MIRQVVFASALCAVWFALAAGAPAPARAAAATPSPAPSPTATPEPLDKQIPRLEAKIKADPSDRESLQQLSADYLTVNRPDLALPRTQKLLQLGSKTAQTYYLDGYSQAALGHPKEALADLEQASNLDPTNSQVLTLLTELYLRSNRPSDAERVAKRAITFNKDDKAALENYGLVLVSEKKYDEARSQFEAAAKVDPKDPTPFILQARSYLDQNAIALAAGSYDRALSVDPNNTDALLGKGRIQSQQHQVKEAVATFEKLVALVPDASQKAQVIDEEARLYATEKMDSEAETAFKRAIASYPNVPEAHNAYGDYLAFKKQMPQALTEWQTALGPNRDNREALARLGDYYGSQNQLSKAIDNYKRLSELAPNDAAVWAQLGQAYGLTKQFDKAHDAYRHAYEISRNPQALAGLGETDFALKNWKEGAAIFEALDKGAPDLFKANPQLFFVMGQVYQNNNQVDKARSAYQRFLPFVKPNSQAATQLKKLIADLNRAPSPAVSAKPKKG